MTADDIIAANPEVTWERATIKDTDCLIGTQKDGTKFVSLWLGDCACYCAMPLRGDSIAHMKQNLRDAQPGKEFKTIRGDKYAKRMRALGLLVERDKDGEPHVFMGSPAPHPSVAAGAPQTLE